MSSSFDKYAYDCLCNEYNGSEQSNSLADLYQMAGLELEHEKKLSREEHLKVVLPKLDKSLQQKVKVIENLRECLQKFSTDCDEEFLNNTDVCTIAALGLFKKNNKIQTSIKIKLHDLRFDIDEILNPESRINRFNILKKMVSEVKENDGSFDHNPLNISAKRMQFFMKSIPAKERLSLLNSIIKKTKNSKAYDYSAFKKELETQKANDDLQEKFEKREENQARYEDILQKELPQARTNKQKIALYEEAMALVSYQDWGRTKKFKTKIGFCNNLVFLYKAEGMENKAMETRAKRDSLEKACSNTEIAAAKKGYTYGKKPQRY